VKGVADPANKPGGRWCYARWKDNAGNLWLFGGIDAASIIGMSFYNDLWKFDVSTNQWTWMNGSNSFNQPGVYGAQCLSSAFTSPGGRGETRACWNDNCGNLWLFGGRDQNFDMYNDLWRYNIALDKWFWVGGSNSQNQPGVFGTMQVPSPANIPGARMGSLSWKNNSGLWLFGGLDYSGNQWNDLWRFTILDTACGLCNIPPVALFSAPNNICPGTCTGFTNQSQGATSYLWTFAGATPSTSSDASPVNICYNSPGSYAVSLIATNAAGSDTLTLSNYITVYPYPPPQGIAQSGDTLFANAGAVSYQWYLNGIPISGATDYFYVASASGDYNVVATDANGCEVEAAIFNVIAHVPAQSTVNDTQSAVFPNPVQETLSVISYQLTGTAFEISVYNVLGEKVMAVCCGLSTVDCRLLVPGLYYLEVSNGTMKFRAKFVRSAIP
jgi:PKD repeat protein